MVDDLAEGGPLGQPAHAGRAEGLVEVGLGESEVRELELGVRVRRVLERVDVGEEVAADAVGVDELGDAALKLGRGDDRLADGLGLARWRTAWHVRQGRRGVAVDRWPSQRGGGGRGEQRTVDHPPEPSKN